MLNFEISISLINLGSLNSLNNLVSGPVENIESNGKFDNKSTRNHPLKYLIEICFISLIYCFEDSS